MQHDIIDGRATWPSEPLYKFLYSVLPHWRTVSGILDVPTIAGALGMSTQAIYKWFHRGNLPAKRARELYALCQEPENLALLRESGVANPPELEAFYQFSN